MSAMMWCITRQDHRSLVVNGIGTNVNVKINGPDRRAVSVANQLVCETDSDVGALVGGNGQTGLSLNVLRSVRSQSLVARGRTFLER
jgi:hypothetical protein